MNEEKQLELLSTLAKKFRIEYNFPRNRTVDPSKYYVNNGFFGSVDGEVLYCMIRLFKPKRILEIGAGYSTYLSAQAILKNKEETPGNECEFVAVDPYPNETIKNGLPGLSKLVIDKCQNLSLSEFKKLEHNDILFIDSSHVLKIGSDVQYECLEILPRLNKGVIVHLHDILLPAEYHKKWILRDHLFWNEQYLLQAFLTFKNSFEVLWASSYMHLKYPERLETAFNSYTKGEQWPVSFWIRKSK